MRKKKFVSFHKWLEVSTTGKRRMETTPPPAFLSLDFHLYYAIIDLRLGIYVWFLCVTRSFLPVRKNVQRHSGEKANLTFLSDSVTKIYILAFLLILAGEGGGYKKLIYCISIIEFRVLFSAETMR